MTKNKLFKDDRLEVLAESANVAQFVSFDDALNVRRSRLLGLERNRKFDSADEATEIALALSSEGRVNVRSYDPASPEGHPFDLGLTTVGEVMGILLKRSQAGLYTIVNETIDPGDGGVSGVLWRGIIEFAPDAIPRCVDDETIQTVSLPADVGIEMLRKVYGFAPDLARWSARERVEFSIHPQPRGCRHEGTIVWQHEEKPVAPAAEATVSVPNAWSRMLGDKVFGLILADTIGLRVPRTIVFSHRLFPFSFGSPTGSGRMRTRSCPVEKSPGYYPSLNEWLDPYIALKAWGAFMTSQGISPLASTIIQENIPAKWSGRAVMSGGGEVNIKGCEGSGDDFMLGRDGEQVLPGEVRDAVADVLKCINKSIGPASAEWVWDGVQPWVVQMNIWNGEGSADVPSGWVRFEYGKGRLGEFRECVAFAKESGVGIVVIGNVSPLSHAGEIAESAGVPVRFELPKS